MKNSFSENIRKFRKENDLKQEAFAAAIAQKVVEEKRKDWSKSITLWENGTQTPPMEVCIAIAELIGISLDDLFKKEIDEFKKNTVIANIEESGKFKVMPNDNLEILTFILKCFDIEKHRQDEEEIELFRSFIGLDDKEENIKTNLSLIIGEQSFSKEFTQSDEIKLYDEIGEWLKTKVFKYFFQQKIFAGISISNVTYNDGTKGYVAEIFLNLSKDDIKELFIEHGKRQAIEIIEKAEDEMIDYTDVLPKTKKGEIL